MKSEQTINIVLIGTDFKSGNFGCSALGYSQLGLLDDIAKKHHLFLNIISVNYHPFEEKTNTHEIKDLQVKLKHLSFYKKYISAMRESDYVLDFTGGDSFTDMYGVARFFKDSILKQIAIMVGAKLIIGPQTIGPFNKQWVRRWATSIMARSYAVFTRDEQSKDYAAKLGVDAILTTDVAFTLKPDSIPTIVSNKKKIGINVSGLLWNGGYTGNNEFGLKLDYKAFCRGLINKCLESGYAVYLISHVVSDDPREDDYAAAEKLKNEFPEVVICEKPTTPMLAKALIGQMDIFIGARMHATVGAFSQGIPTIPIAYSRKFEGLFGSLNYPYVIDSKKMTTEDALEKTLDGINNYLQLKANVESSRQIVDRKSKAYIEILEKEILK